MFGSIVAATDEEDALLQSIRKKAKDLAARDALSTLTEPELYFLAGQSRVLRDMYRHRDARIARPGTVPSLPFWERITHSCERVSRQAKTRMTRPASLAELYTGAADTGAPGDRTETCVCGRFRHLSSHPDIPPTRWQKPEKWPSVCTRDRLYVLRRLALNQLCAGLPRRRQIALELGLVLTRWRRYPELTAAKMHARRRNFRARQIQGRP